MAEWCQLPKELLQLISECLNDSILYLIRFRSVCSTWRSSIPNPIHHHFHHHLAFKLPRFHGINNNDSNANAYASTFSLSKRTIFLITPPPPPPQQHQQTLPLPLRPWLIEIDQDSRGRTHLWHPLKRDSRLPFRFPHVLDFNQLRVFDLGHVFFLVYPPPINSPYTEKVVAATWQGDKEGFGSVLLTIDVFGQLALFHCADERWTVIPYMSMRYDDICVFKGQPCAVDGDGRTVTVRPDSSVDLVAEPVLGGNRKFLVESEGELLLVDKQLSSDRFEDECEWWKKAVTFDVYRLEEREKRWVQMTSLGDRVLFLGIDSAFSASASDLCVGKGNCVVFRDNADCELRAFHLDEGEASPLSDDDPGYHKLFWPPPDWLGLH